MDSWSFHLVKTKEQFQWKPKENTFPASPFLSFPLFWAQSSFYEKDLGLIVLSCFQQKPLYSLLVWRECRGPPLWDLKLCLPSIPLKGRKGRGHFPAGRQVGELTLLPSLLHSWCLVWGKQTHVFTRFERSEVQLPTFGFSSQNIHLTTKLQVHRVQTELSGNLFTWTFLSFFKFLFCLFLSPNFK